MAVASGPRADGTGDPGTRAPDPVVECTGLAVRYGPLTAVDDLSFRASAGEVLALLGPNGAGKTSTLEVLMGYRRPSSGRVRVRGLDPSADHRALVGKIGVMLQRGGIYPMLGPRQALRLFASYYPDPEDPEELLGLLALGSVARTPWRHLSGGEQQRLSLALALVGRPEVLFLDEPTAGVDPHGRQVVRQVIERRRDRGAAVLLTTHELPEAERLADRVLIVHRGRAVAEGSPADLASEVGDEQVSFGAPPGLDLASLASALGAPVEEGAPGRYVVRAAGSPQLTARLAQWLADRNAALGDLRTTRSLEDAYLALVGEAGEGGGDGGAGRAGGTGETGRAGGPR